jgi:hypothetical protein
MLASALLALLLAACAAQVPVREARLQPLVAAATEFSVAVETELVLPTGYRRKLVPGTRWLSVGSLPEGTVYRPVDTVFSIEGRHVHEAYLVIQAGSLRGFYLPGESRYSPLSSPVNLNQGAQR